MTLDQDNIINKLGFKEKWTRSASYADELNFFYIVLKSDKIGINTLTLDCYSDGSLCMWDGSTLKSQKLSLLQAKRIIKQYLILKNFQ